VTVDIGLVGELRAEVLAGLSARQPSLPEGRGGLGGGDEQAYGRQLISEALDRHARRAVTAGAAVLSATAEDELSRAVFDALFRMDRPQRLLDDLDVENINANGCDQVWVRYADGRRARAEPIADSDRVSSTCSARPPPGWGSGNADSISARPGCRCSSPTGPASSP